MDLCRPGTRNTISHLVETHDPRSGSAERRLLLIAHYGKGVYVYNAFALYRQLPAGNARRVPLVWRTWSVRERIRAGN